MTEPRVALGLASLVLSAMSCTTPVTIPATAPAPGDWSPEAALSSPPQRQQGPRRGAFYGLIGSKKLDDTEAWERLDRPFTFGGEGELRFGRSPFAAEFGALFGFDHATTPTFFGTADVDSYLFEFYGGPRFVFDFRDAPLTTYVGLGLTSIYADVTTYNGFVLTGDYDWSLGFYIHGGVSAWLTPEVSLGIDVRSVTGTSARLFGVDTDIDYLQIAGTLGFAF